MTIFLCLFKRAYLSNYWFHILAGWIAHLPGKTIGHFPQIIARAGKTARDN